MKPEIANRSRPAAVAGSWYPGDRAALRSMLATQLAGVEEPQTGEIVGLIVPHAGLVYSGPVAAHAYRAVTDRQFDVVVLVGPSHYEVFDGVAIYPSGAFETPLGSVVVASDVADRLMTSPVIGTHPRAHVREHSLEMQLPFLQRVLSDTPIVPLLIGRQVRETILALADALVTALSGLTPLLVASTDLSYYFHASRAAALDQVVIDHVARFDAHGLMSAYERYPAHERGRFVACGSGAACGVMLAAAGLGARDARVLSCADSGDVSGDKSAVVGYLAAAFGCFTPSPSGQASPRVVRPVPAS